MQFLFGLEFTQDDWQTALPGFWAAYPSRPKVMQYAQALIEGVVAERDALDASIAQCLENWTPERVGRVERNVLRVALYEMRHMSDVPLNAAINEAIEIAKSYGSDDAPRFVNGVLACEGGRATPGKFVDLHLHTDQFGWFRFADAGG